ncbi:MAG: leucine-rich repeat domain-containing protein [Clostridia bacterium]|nr:leucine-rich repeat domain-containing protein [Clostridia bacterium]
MKKKLIAMNKKMKKKYIIGLSIGAGALVLIIATLLIVFRHVHTFGEWEKIRDASCTQQGVERRFCDCGEMQEKKYDKLPHVESDWIYDKEKDNLKKICTSCGKNLQFNSLENHTHNWSDYVTKTEPTCTSEGMDIRTCNCGAIDEKIISAKDHSFDEWKITLESKCGVEGTESRTCLICNEIESKSISALSHIEGAWVVIDGKKAYPCVYCKTVLRTEEIDASEYLDISNDTVIGLGSCEDIEIVIPSNFNNQSITKIGENSFEYQVITGVILTNSITEIGNSAFSKCLELTNIHLGNNLTSIGQKAFYNCKSLTSITLPDTLKTLSDYSFAYCTNLEYIKIGNEITKLPMYVFSDCTSLKEIHFNGTKEQWNNLEKDNDWDKNTGDYIVYCIDGEIIK